VGKAFDGDELLEKSLYRKKNHFFRMKNAIEGCKHDHRWWPGHDTVTVTTTTTS
jgi:hypothetical protein